MTSASVKCVVPARQPDHAFCRPHSYVLQLLTLKNPGQNPITTRAMTIPEQIQATRDTCGRQMAPPSGKSLFNGTLSHNATGPTGDTMYPNRHFTPVNLREYHPLSSFFDANTKHRVILAHCRLKYLFQPVPTHSALQWLWQLKFNTETVHPIPDLLP